MGFHTKPTTFVGHVKVKVENLQRSIQFYIDVLGFDILEQTTTTVELTTDGKTSFLSLEQPENVIPKQGRTTGLYHFAILLPTQSDLANIVVHLVDKGVRFGSSDHLVSEALYLHDPDGNEIEIYRDRAPSEWNWKDDEVAMAVDPIDFKNLLKHVTPDKTWRKMPAETVMGHIHLHVSELKKTEEFYVKGLGMDVVNRYGEQALFLSYGKYHHHLGVNTWNGVGAPAPAKNSVGLESYTLIFDNEEARQQTVANLKKIGAEVLEENNHFITFDPSGNAIKLAV
ncbi:VOC family protein [Bacillus sp. DTU_2020_1000418_1_SI_GHA_SEK_038]|uniref:VOC family protein n=1 Tax=Bacillus sp. DTU_2020_1000418_1_SI_GHA_SEK_038 TaxID=3077585 RepID=UPI0028F0DB94|nr:VOC family protein [Bacillus sp. DTU_2020_1000418_1_SI_GHA_SEK_038]WNS75444.1 VOC family protein [Bacillus sp. DTU_2020_1000418_1_SI_GHA_SEK_038]